MWKSAVVPGDEPDAAASRITNGRYRLRRECMCELEEVRIVRAKPIRKTGAWQLRKGGK
jgi:hypothetical protein